MRILQFRDFSGRHQGINRQKIGAVGEQIARSYLKKLGWRILDTNVRFGQDELDILAMCPREETISIVEVRTTARKGTRPEDTITQRKRKAMRRVARHVQTEAIKHRCSLRVDLIAVQLADSHESPKIRHYKGVLPIRKKKNTKFSKKKCYIALSLCV